LIARQNVKTEIKTTGARPQNIMMFIKQATTVGDRVAVNIGQQKLKNQHSNLIKF